MKARIIRIGNSRGIRIPQELLRIYRLDENSTVELEEQREGILLKPQRIEDHVLSWEETYKEMAVDAEDRTEWEEWDTTSGDGLT